MSGLDEGAVAGLVRAVGLELDDDRVAAVTAAFEGLFEAAQELNRRMSDPAVHSLTPAISFVPGPPAGGGATP